MELRDYIRILRKSWLLIVVLMLVGVASSATFSILQTPKYSASSKVFVSTASDGGSVSDLQQGNSFTVQRVKTYSQLAITPIVLQPVIDSLNLDTEVDALAANVSVSAVLDSAVLEVSVVDADPANAAEIANGIAESLTTVVQLIETPETEGAVSPVKLTTVQIAEAPSAPVSPRVPLNIALGFLVGLALGVGIAVLREVLDTRVRNERDLELISDAPIIGGIAYDPKAAERPLIVQSDPRSPRAESFRTLRTNLSFIDFGERDRAFVITSSVASEGKSTTAANLAISLSDSGVRVLLVDADLRRPKVGEYMGLEGAVGLTDVLIGKADLKDVMQPWGRNKLFVLPAGRIPPNPSELLGSIAMAKLIEVFNREFDYVIFDAPPLLPVTDAAILAKRVGGAILVIAAGKTHKGQVQGAVAALANVDAPISGLVLTMLPTKGPDAYGYGHYGHSYGYGYEIDEAKK
ncbi:polysaccharide biosynthesis tyrosine autokinase [Salinibacterium sp. UTAS2018]|uniref:polysaccharide biosynthesis tyrosine autokinase n=1 Tax=Salinibacterium sp. UTAS2018 TaxID=2508880 RepID=UPI001009847A|nr:polysaccharide biosynthesis tyrosine autokinase [Salinibacterium sp. UTAS2018]QAV70457.1 polysaccharide biosynthesis tyrosine autokinase [Salinibacterium sp. UTAS2018]